MFGILLVWKIMLSGGDWIKESSMSRYEIAIGKPSVKSAGEPSEVRELAVETKVPKTCFNGVELGQALAIDANSMARDYCRRQLFESLVEYINFETREDGLQTILRASIMIAVD